MTLDKGLVWRKINRRLLEGATVRTWSERTGHGPAFRIDAVSPAGVLIRPTSTGKQRRVSNKVIDAVVDRLNAEAPRTGGSVHNATYAKGILKHVGAL